MISGCGVRRELELVCKVYRVTLEQVYAQSRLASVTDARAACWAFLRAKGKSYPEIGIMWGRDHATILRGVRRWNERL